MIDKLDLQITSMHQTDSRPRLIACRGWDLESGVKVGEGEIRENVQTIGKLDTEMFLAHLMIDKFDLQITFMHQTDSRPRLIACRGWDLESGVKVGEGEIRENVLVQTIGKLDTETFLAHLMIDKFDLQITFMHQTDSRPRLIACRGWDLESGVKVEEEKLERIFWLKLSTTTTPKCPPPS